MKKWLAKGLAHIGIMTKDVDGCVAFYVDKLGFESYYEYALPDGRKLGFVRGGGCVIEFIETSAETRPAGAIDHVAIEVLGLNSLVEELKAAGITFEMETNNSLPGLFPTGSRMNFFTGPAGERIELYEYGQ